MSQVTVDTALEMVQTAKLMLSPVLANDPQSRNNVMAGGVHS
jgi:hypothetical protein